MRRVLGTVVVAVRGPIEGPECDVLDRVLTDLVDGQGNLAVEVDLTRAQVVDAATFAIVRRAAELARRHGGELVVR